MNLKSAIKTWLTEPVKYPNGRSYTRGENIMYTAICLAALPVLVGVGMLVMMLAGSTLAGQSAGSLAGRGLKLAILSVL